MKMKKQFTSKELATLMGFEAEQANQLYILYMHEKGGYEVSLSPS